MKFISTTTNAPFIFEAALDTSLFRELTRDGDILTASFDIATIVPSLPYFQGTDMDLVIDISAENIYISAILYVGLEDIDNKFQPYEEDGMIPFNVILTEEEKIKILIYFIKHYFMH